MAQYQYVVALHAAAPCLPRPPPEIRLFATVTDRTMFPSCSALITTDINHKPAENHPCLVAGDPASRSTGSTDSAQLLRMGHSRQPVLHSFVTQHHRCSSAQLNALWK